MFTEDLTEFTDTDDHGESIVYEGTSVDAVVENVTFETMAGDRTIEVTKVLYIDESDITVPVSGQRVKVDGYDYIVAMVGNESGMAVISIGRLSS